MSSPEAASPVHEPGPPEHKHMSVRKHLVLDTSIIVGVSVLWLLGVLSYKWLAPHPLPKVDLGTTDDPLVVVHVEQLNPTEQLLEVKVLLRPDESIINRRLNRLTAESAVRFVSQNDMAELQYHTGKAPEWLSTTIDARGKATEWPVDEYVTDPIQAEWLVGAADTSHYEPARVEVEGAVDGFDIHLERVASSDPKAPAAVVIKLKRTKAQQFFDIGICLVLIALPALALFVAIQMVTRRRPFLPPFGTWYAAMLFAVVPLRNFLPGSPPTGAWIDQGLVIWVLLGLATAMVIYIIAWYRDRA
nr:DUF4436 domain-containing protein [Mycobacterium asiaticum]